ECRTIHPPMCIFPVDLHRDELEPIPIEPKLPVVIAIALDAQAGAHPGPVGVEVEVEADLGHEPVGRAVILAADRGMRRRRRRLGRGFAVGKGTYVCHRPAALSWLNARHNPSAMTAAANRRSWAAQIAKSQIAGDRTMSGFEDIREHMEVIGAD